MLPRFLSSTSSSGVDERGDIFEDTDTSEDTSSEKPGPGECVPAVYTFVNNVDSYFGCTDIEIRQRFPDEARFSEVELIADRIGDAAFPYTSRSEVLIRMRDIFGYAADRIPPTARITRASLTVFSTEATPGDVALHRMLADWHQSTTWNALGGVTPNGVEASLEADDVLSAPGADQSYTFDVIRSLAAWQADPAENRGWVILNSSDDGWGILSSETVSPRRRPRLEVEVCGTLPGRVRNLPPEILAPVDPLSGSMDVPSSVVLDAVVIDADSDPLDITFYGREKGSDFWTAIVLPDTQYYTLDAEWPKGIFTGQTQWIADNRDALDIRMVLSAGDIVENASVAEHWTRADAALSTLIDADIPYMPTPGDHDHENQWEDGSLAAFSATFPETRFDGDAWWGDVFDDSNSSHYVLLTVGADDYLFLGLDFCPDANEIAWANDILDQYANRKAILTTHALMDDNGGYYATLDCGRYEGDAFYIWKTLVSRHDNLKIALSGHMHLNDGEYRRTDDNVNGVPVHLVMADYQMRPPDLGNGLLRIMTFFPSDDEIQVRTYSPYLDAFETDADSQFVLPFEMEDDRPFEPIGSAFGVPSGAHATHFWDDLSPDTTYEWYVVASDGALDTQGPVWEFTTAPGE